MVVSEAPEVQCRFKDSAQQMMTCTDSAMTSTKRVTVPVSRVSSGPCVPRAAGELDGLTQIWACTLMIQNWRATQLGVSESAGWNIDARGAARSLPRSSPRQRRNDTQKQNFSKKCATLDVTASLVAIFGTAFHQYQQYERLANNLAQIAASAAKGGCALPFYDY